MKRQRILAVAVVVAVGLVGAYGAASVGPVDAFSGAADDPVTETGPPDDSDDAADGDGSSEETDTTNTDTSDGNDAPDDTRLLYDGDRLTLSATDSETIRGETPIEPGSTVTVRLASTESSSPFLHQETATVDDDGIFAVTMDLRGTPNESSFEAVVRHDGETVADASGIVVGGTSESEPADDERNLTQVDEAAENGASAHFVHEGENLTLQADADQPITAETDLSDGTTVSVRVSSADNDNPFLMTESATVEDGTVDASVDLSTLDPDEDATVEVRLVSDGETLAVTEGVVES